MEKIPQKKIHQYLRHDKKFPHVWCAGCSNGIVLGSTIRAIAQLDYKKDDIAMVSGIGCSSRMPVYVDFNTLHSLHGRAIAYATGIKMYKPEMKVIVVTGDGDATAIGGNHFIHAARRNLDLTVILINNNIYGMTGGQFSPTTPIGARATTSMYGNIDPTFDICRLAKGSGATFVARTSAFHAQEAQNFIRAGLQHKGFSVIEIVSACPVIYGRLNRKGDASKMMLWMKENVIPVKAYEKLPDDKKEDKITRGILVQEERQEYTEAYENLMQSLKPEAGDK
ncbi:MAG: 2-oxoacid:ferredoxin oxidoreductase subunit beta [Candidatus Cloacimonetes bacterium]|nr:2-oxoacid:ferredoxin oxidoreductase subunit beta [Candidatus Cloacimonadota bacterium]MCF7813454.1 2-oxoacid:ferredoxin oxidoreductase subunit beta [Candidatus Cloacimonadota bacterium]MCF7867747.1 2-oxoacid:ferredoxin oxidoreductase subunit beta [Candidatus Cloacimonadota bacterium]MCF7883167.1 2-oxoacid:ferredoxin oxidoreductase subunit beta [Candidatus Cloacimonadota bacterium]